MAHSRVILPPTPMLDLRASAQLTWVAACSITHSKPGNGQHAPAGAGETADGGQATCSLTIWALSRSQMRLSAAPSHPVRCRGRTDKPGHRAADVGAQLTRDRLPRCLSHPRNASECSPKLTWGAGGAEDTGGPCTWACCTCGAGGCWGCSGASGPLVSTVSSLMSDPAGRRQRQVSNLIVQGV